MPSFDIASKLDAQLLDNAINVAKKDILNRWDFRDSKSSIELNKKEMVINISTENDMRLEAIIDAIHSRMIKQGLDPRGLDETKAHYPSGPLIKKDIKARQGIDKEASKKIMKDIKDSKLKVTAQIMDDIIRVSAKKIDDLQAVIALCRRGNYEIPLQFITMTSGGRLEAQVFYVQFVKKMRAVLLIFVLCMSSSVRGQSITEPHFSNLSINSMGDLQWTVTYHQDLSFSVHIEKLVNDKWVDLGLGLGGFSLAEKDPSLLQTTTSSTRVKFHKGLNLYRLVMTFPDKIVSPEIKLESETSNDDGSLWIVNNSIQLDEAVDYEILNSVGTVMAKGEGKTINISNLKEGSYFLYTKNWTKSFSK